MLGRFWAIGVGPGDPELLTLKAVNLLRRVQAIYHAGPEAQQGRAWEIICGHVQPHQEVRVVLAEPVSLVSAGDWRAAYLAGVERIAADCRRGWDVAYVTEGDPTLYSTAACVWQLLQELHPEIAVEIIPGVSAITAAAARAGWPLAQRDAMVAVVPASYHRDDLGQLLDKFETLCLLKPAAVMPDIVRALQQPASPREMVYVENVGSASEFLSYDPTTLTERQTYFSLLIVRRAGARSGTMGRPPAKIGKVWVVGLGPGDPRLLTPQARASLDQAEVVIGYEGYLRLLAPLSLRAELQSSPLGAESARAKQALELAQAGRRVALVSSGDAGVYGMASLLLERAERTPEVDVEIVPGVTAATAAAAVLGAPLGHDFACLSLSDLLTPWDLIEHRLAAASQSDYVLVLYNPTSRRRTWQLQRARTILLQHRRPETPVGLVDRAYRPGQRVWQTTLGEWTTQGAGMETLVIVGNSQTRWVQGRMVTPRGYSEKQQAKEHRSKDADLGRAILQESFAIIERELGPHAFPTWAHAVVRRMIHASADFEFAQTLRYSAGFESAFQTACRAQVPIVADTEMVLSGIRGAAAHFPGISLVCPLNDVETLRLADAAGLTRSAAGVRLAARRYPKPLLAIGSAPTALAEAVRLIEEEGWRPAALVGMPVGFVGVVEAKERLLRQAHVPYLTCVGRKGGSAVTAAAVNALLECCFDGS